MFVIFDLENLFIYNWNWRVISERSQICTTSSNETSINDEYPRLNHYNSKLNTISYPRELIIASSPIKKLYRAAEASVNESEQELQSDASSRKNSEQYAEHSHVNYGYNLTFDSDLPFESNTYNKNNNTNHYNQNKLSVSSIDSNNFNLKAFWKNEKNLDNIIHQKSDMYERRLELAKIVNNIPHSFEKQMARNFHNLTGNSSSPINSASLETGSSDFINRYSKYTDTTSISTNQSLKDEDAWLPILNLAEEQVIYIETLIHHKIKHFLFSANLPYDFNSKIFCNLVLYAYHIEYWNCFL